MNTMFTEEERKDKIEKCIEIVNTMSREELIAFNKLLDALMKEYADAQK